MLIAAADDHQALKVRLNLGYAEPKVETILKAMTADETLRHASRETHTSSINCPQKTREKIIQTFEAEHFVFAPIQTQPGSIGFVFAGNRINAKAVTQGDDELITILAGQIGQSIENAQLFEKVFRSSQELELKVGTAPNSWPAPCKRSTRSAIKNRNSSPRCPTN